MNPTVIKTSMMLKFLPGCLICLFFRFATSGSCCSVPIEHKELAQQKFLVKHIAFMAMAFLN